MSLQQVIGALREKISTMVEEQEKAHGRGILMVEVQEDEKARFMHLPGLKFKKEDFLLQQLFDAKDDDICCMFKDKDGKQQFAMLSREGLKKGGAAVGTAVERGE